MTLPGVAGGEVLCGPVRPSKNSDAETALAGDPELYVEIELVPCFGGDKLDMLCLFF